MSISNYTSQNILPNPIKTVILKDGFELKLFEPNNSSLKVLLIVLVPNNSYINSASRINQKLLHYGYIDYDLYIGPPLIDYNGRQVSSTYYYETAYINISQFEDEESVQFYESVISQIKIAFNKNADYSLLKALESAKRYIDKSKLSLRQLVGKIGELFFIYQVAIQCSPTIAKRLFDDYYQQRENGRIDINLPNNRKLEIKSTISRSATIKNEQRNLVAPENLTFAFVYLKIDENNINESQSNFNFAKLVVLLSSIGINVLENEVIKQFEQNIRGKDLIQKYFLIDEFNIFLIDDLLPRIEGAPTSIFKQITYKLELSSFESGLLRYPVMSINDFFGGN